MASQPRTIDLDNLPLEQLHQMQQSEESRLSAMTSHYSTFRASAQKLASARESLDELTPGTEGKDIMIPLTESLYVPGKIRDRNVVMVELGTGYYAEKQVKEAQAFLERKQKLVDLNSENIMEVITTTRSNLTNIQMAMQSKIMQIKLKQEGQRVKASDEANQ
jgi:prefoldin alpha subunit